MYHCVASTAAAKTRNKSIPRNTQPQKLALMLIKGEGISSAGVGVAVGVRGTVVFEEGVGAGLAVGVAAGVEVFVDTGVPVAVPLGASS